MWSRSLFWLPLGVSCDILPTVNPLRNPNINYFKGWFFVTFQVAMNKSVFGVISDKILILNALGEMVRNNLLGLGRIFPELYIDTAMVMPNHVHVVLKIDSHDEKKDLTYFNGRFKSFTTNQYHRLVKAGECVDVGARLVGRQLLRQFGEQPSGADQRQELYHEEPRALGRRSIRGCVDVFGF